MLARVHGKIEFALSMIDVARATATSRDGLWYHAQGMTNAFYAILEELNNTVKNKADATLREILARWFDANRTTLDGFFGKARQLVTHQGEVEVESGLDWIVDHMRDTENPVQYATITVKGTKIEEMRGDAFLDLCQKAFEFLRRGLVEIEGEYLNKGGNLRLRPSRLEWDEAWKWIDARTAADPNWLFADPLEIAGAKIEE